MVRVCLFFMYSCVNLDSFCSQYLVYSPAKLRYDEPPEGAYLFSRRLRSFGPSTKTELAADRRGNFISRFYVGNTITQSTMTPTEGSSNDEVM